MCQVHRAVALLYAAAVAPSASYALESISWRYLLYDGEYDRCKWACPPVDPFCLSPTWQCSRSDGVLRFEDEDKALIRDSFNAIVNLFSVRDLADAHYECTQAVTSEWPSILAQPGEDVGTGYHPVRSHFML
jgi:hypothetical protein